MLDYELVSSSALRQLRTYKIFSEGSFSSTSDHLPILALLSLEFNLHSIKNSHFRSPSLHKVKEEHIQEYQRKLNEQLEPLLNETEITNNNLDDFYATFINVVKTVADATIPKCGFNPRTKP